MKKIILFLFSFAALGSCTNNSFEELAPKPECDTSALMSFSKDITPILKDKKCISCHYFPGASTFKFVMLDTYDEVNKVVLSGQLLKAIKHEPGVTPMPYQLQMLDACTIGKIDKWVREGHVNN
jgi:hypothetical protein